MGRVKNLHWSMKDREEWTNEDWDQFFFEEYGKPLPKKKTKETDGGSK